MPYKYEVFDLYETDDMTKIINRYAEDGFEPHMVFERTMRKTLSGEVKLQSIVFRKMVRKARKKKT